MSAAEFENDASRFLSRVSVCVDCPHLSLLPPPHPLIQMTSYQAMLEKMRAQATIGDTYRREVREAFKTAVARVEGEARCIPDDKEELEEDQAIWVKRFGAAMVSGGVVAGGFGLTIR